MLEKLRQLGWGDYEAKAYLALLGHHPATGYRVAKESGVPTAKVYEALARLVERGAIRLHPGAEGEAAQYVPVPPEEVMAGLRARHARMLDELTRELASLFAPSAAAPEAAWLRGRAPVLGRANTLLAAARQSVALALPWGWESALRAGLETARSRRVRMDRVALSAEGATGQTEPGLLVLVVDGRETLIGTLGSPTDDAAAEALASQAPFLARLAADYVRLRRALALVPDAVARLQRHDDWLDWEEAKQRRLLQHTALPRPDRVGGSPN
ncbi:MAG TPA: helix-turn-helix domain-containing protein [Chthonomonadaceae bacterium]|nr:helix-turn-helix domain-containing protein [Chthonomonadaceae bacterium]